MSSALPGWYPDPSGADGRYRWWDGAGWTDAVGAAVDASPPTSALRTAPARSPHSASRRILALSVGFALFVSVGIGIGLVVWRDPAPAASSAGGPTLSAPQPAASGARPRGELAERTRRATIDSATMVLPGPPYQLYGDPMRVEALLDVLFVAHAPVHRHYDGQRTWSAMVGFAALDPSLPTADLEATGVIALRRLTARVFAQQKTTLRRVSAADHAVDGRPGVLVTGQVHYRLPRLRSRYDRVTALVVKLDDGAVVAGLSLVPDDAPPTVSRLAQAAVESLRVS